MRKNMLFISTHLPSTKVPQAGHREAYETLKRYSGVYNVYLIAFVNTFEEQYFNKDELSFCTFTHFVKLHRIKKIFGVLNHLALPLRIASRADRSLIRLIRRLESDVTFDVVHFYFTAAMYYRPFIKMARVMETTVQDILFQSFHRRFQQGKFLLKGFYFLDYQRLKKWEVHNFCRIDKANVLNDKDKKLLIEAGVPEDKIKVIQPFVDEKFRTVSRKNIEKNSLLFWGAMNRIENVDAVQWFLEEIFPMISRKVTTVRFYIVGANPPQKLLKYQSDSVIVTGFVEQPLSYFEKATIAVVPLRLGAGIKIKVLECLAAQVPVVTTTVGAEGIDNNQLFVSDDPVKFADLVCSLLEK